MDNQDTNSNAQAFNFLNEIYDVMKCFENNPAKLTNKINELKAKFDKARSVLATMPGIDMSLVEQQEYYESLLKKYKKDKELLVQYKELCQFDISQLEKGPSEEFLNSKNQTTNETSIANTKLEPLENDSVAHQQQQFDANSFQK